MPSEGTSPTLLTVQDVATWLRVPVSWVYAKAEAGELPSLKLGRYRRFSAAAITLYLERAGDGNGSHGVG